MTLAQSIIAYAVSWWMVIFMLAPVGAARITDATRRKSWVLKLLGATVLAALMTWGVGVLIDSGLISVK